jgi:hypothetical protein
MQSHDRRASTEDPETEDGDQGGLFPRGALHFEKCGDREEKDPYVD